MGLRKKISLRHFLKMEDSVKNRCSVRSDIVWVAKEFPYNVRGCKVLMASIKSGSKIPSHNLPASPSN